MNRIESALRDDGDSAAMCHAWLMYESFMRHSHLAPLDGGDSDDSHLAPLDYSDGGGM